MKKKWLGSIAIVLVLALATVGVTFGDEAKLETKSLSLAQAVEIALQDNNQVGLAELGVERANLDVEKAELAKKKMINILANPDRKDQNAAMVIDVVPTQAQGGKVIADITKIYTDNNIRFGVEAAYFGVLLAEESEKLSEASYTRAQEQLKQAQAKYNAGTVAKFDVISAEAQLKSAEAAVNEAKSTVEKARMSLNKTLNLNLDTPLKLTDKLSYTKTDAIDVQAVFQEMTEENLPYVAAEETYKMNQVNWAHHQKYYTKNTFAYQEAEYNMKESEVNFNAAQADLMLNIKSAYLDLETAEDNYQVLTKSIEQAKEALRLTKLQYDVGMATGYDVLNADTALKGAELSLLNALYSYNLAKAKFTYGIFTS
ncbi:MAG: TolC family protein [Dehalobacterium sp.]